MPHACYRIGIIGHWEWHSGREIFRGARRFKNDHEGVEMQVIPFAKSIDEKVLAGFDGFLLQRFASNHLRYFKDRPAVYLDYLFPPKDAHSLIIENTDVGRLAAEHLRLTPAKYFAYCDTFYSRTELDFDPEGTGRTKLRFAGYRDALMEHQVVRNPEKIIHYSVQTERESELIEWVASLPKPVAIFCFNDNIASKVVHACSYSGIEMKDSVFVIGADNDPQLCGVAGASVTSIELGFDQLGYEGARLLHCLLRQEPVDEIQYRLSPPGVVQRESTVGFYSDDPVVQETYRCICESALGEYDFTDIAAKHGISLGYLETKFRDVSGRTITGQLQTERCKHAAFWLRTTSDSMESISRRSGFHSYPNFVRNFQKYFGCNPSEFRRTNSFLID